MHTPTCPEHPADALSPKKKGWYCPTCDDVVLTYEEHPRTSDPTAPVAAPPPASDVSLADALPTLLALPLREAAHEAAPVPALWALCDLAETALKFIVMAGVAEHVAGKGRLPDALEAELRDRVELPTMGKWLGMALAVARHAPAGSSLPLSPIAGTLDTLLGGRDATPDTGLLALRNRLAHGGPVGRAEAERLLAQWRPRVLAWAADSLSVLTGVALVAIDAAGDRYLLRGPTGRPLVRDDADDGGVSELLLASAPAGSVWLCVGTNALPLGPLGAFDLDQRAVQIYVRSGEVLLQYLRLGEEGGLCDSDVAARDLFQRIFLSRRSATSDGPARFSVRDFDTELRREASRRVGREHELATLGAAVRAMGTGALWLGGPAGIGKSNLVAALIEDFAAHPPMGAIVLPYRFRAGDDRCGRSPFLTYVRERLEASGALVEDAHHERPDDTAPGAEGGSPPSATPPPRPPQTDPMQEVRDLLARLRPERRLLLVLDGLDELVERDPRFVDDVLVRLRTDRVAIVAAGRPERGLPQAFARIGATEPFPEGLPAMTEADVRALLLERTGPVRKRLLARDREAEGALRNGFVEVVTRRSDGLPIYVNHVIGDLNAGRLSPESTDALPASLHAYHDELLRRAAVGDLQAVTTPTLVLLSLAFEPLSAEELAALLVRCGRLDGPSTELVERAVHAIGSMVRKAPDPDGNEGYTLFHHSLRTHVLQGAHLRETVGALRRALADAAGHPAGDAAEVYLYRCGVQHLLDADRPAEALGILTDFERLMARFQRLEATGRAADEWYADWDRVRPRVGGLEGAARHWWDLARTTRHLYRKAGWEPWRVLFQSAMDHADDSAVTHAAEAYEASGRRDWAWLRWLDRPKEWREDPCVAVMVGHRGGIYGVSVLDDGRLLSWSGDATLRIWNASTGALLLTLNGHTDHVVGATALGKDRILSWSWDGTLRTWDAVTGVMLETMRFDLAGAPNARVLGSGNILSCSWDTIQMWDASTGQALRSSNVPCNKISTSKNTSIICSWGGSDPTLHILDSMSGDPVTLLRGHTDSITGACVFDGNRVLSWSWDTTLRTWDGLTGAPLAIFDGHTDTITGALMAETGRMLSWSDDNTLCVWDGHTGRLITRLKGHDSAINGALVSTDDLIVSWSDDGTLRTWAVSQDEAVNIMRGHSDAVVGAMTLKNGQLVSWSTDTTLRLWEPESGTAVDVLAGHTQALLGAIELIDGRLLSWSHDCTLRAWNTDRERPGPDSSRATMPRLFGTSLVQPCHILSWHEDGSFRAWDSARGELVRAFDGHAGTINGVLVMGSGRFLSWSEDSTLRLWEGPVASSACTLRGHTDCVDGAILLHGGRVASWSSDHTIHVWDINTGVSLHVLSGHVDRIRNALQLSNGTVISWSTDHTLRIWDAARGASIATLVGHTNWVWGCQEMPDRRILSWSSDATLRLWDQDNGTPVSTYGLHRTTIGGAVPVRNAHVASWAGAAIHVWHAETGTFHAALLGHTGGIRGAIVLSNNHLLSWSHDHTLRLWDPDSGALLATLEGHTAWVNGAVELAGQRILSWSGDATVRIWDTDTGAPLAAYASPRDWVDAPEDVIDARPADRVLHHSIHVGYEVAHVSDDLVVLKGDRDLRFCRYIPPRPRS